MNREQDVDQLIRSWLDDGPEVAPERYVWAALERIETTHQRGALWASLEDIFMRMQPIAAAIGAAAVVIVGLAAYFALSGGPGIGDPDETTAPATTTFVSSQFATPISFEVPEGWVTYEAGRGVVSGSQAVDGVAVGERLVIFRTTGTEIFSGLADGFVPWPDDLAAWLADNPATTEAEGLGSMDVRVTAQSAATVAGSAATVIEATSSYTAPGGGEASADFITPGAEGDGTDVLLRPGEMTWRFVTIPDRELAIAYGAPPDEFSEERFETVLDSLTIAGE